jgi:hypothetical protein
LVFWIFVNIFQCIPILVKIGQLTGISHASVWAEVTGCRISAWGITSLWHNPTGVLGLFLCDGVISQSDRCHSSCIQRSLTAEKSAVSGTIYKCQSYANLLEFGIIFIVHCCYQRALVDESAVIRTQMGTHSSSSEWEDLYDTTLYQ